MNRSGVKFNIFYSVEGGGEQLFSFNPYEDSSLIQKLTLQDTYGTAVRYFVELVLDGALYPSPESGFDSIDAMWEWLQSYWSTIGSWTHSVAEKKIALTVNAKTGIFDIKELNGIQVQFPILGVGEFYFIVFNGQAAPQELLYTPDQAVSWVQSNWGQNGTWTTDGIYLIYKTTEPGDNTLEILPKSVGAFSDGFSDGFN